MHVVTVYAFGRPSILRAKTQRQLARQLYLACPWWTRKACEHLALELLQNRVVLASNFEAIVLPGEWPVLEVHPSERGDYKPVWA